MSYRNLTWICGHIGFLNDSICMFLNLHVDKHIGWGIVQHRMRTTRPGILLNWAHYYPRWKEQVRDPALERQLFLDHNPKFCQAHFFRREDQILDRFPGSRSISLCVKNINTIDTYLCFAHFKLLDKKLFGSWYETQKLNFPLTMEKNRRFADEQFRLGMTALQYRSIAWLDWQGLLAFDCADPVTVWNQHPYHDNFMENRATIQHDMLHWTNGDDRKMPIFIDELIDIPNRSLNGEYYLNICDMINLKPDLQFFHEFWKNWLSYQPDPCTYKPRLSWDLGG